MASRVLPQTFKKIVARQLSPKFRDATEITSTPMLSPGPGEVLVKNRYVGINASDVNFTAGRYFAGGTTLPFDCGFEAIGKVVSLGPDCKSVKPGQHVCYTQFGAFAEYVVLRENIALPVPSPRPEYLPLIVSGLTAAIGLDRVGDLKPEDKVLVTAAAGGTGQFAVQWAKAVGCHVIGVCSSEDKVRFLKSIGCDRIINYTEENMKAVLQAEYPKGVDVVYECVGGKMFETCLNALALKGRLIVIGYISGYDSATGTSDLSLQTPTLVRYLLAKSASIRGFFLPQYAEDYKKYLVKLVGLFEQGKLQSHVDLGTKGGAKLFHGLESIGDAVEYMYARKNVGKVVVQLDE